MIKPRYTSKVAVTRPNNSTPYDALDVLGTDPATVIEFANIAPQGGGTIVILYASLMVNVGSGGPSQTRLHLYSSAPTAIADNAAYNLPSGDRARYLGSITLNTPADLGDTLFSQEDMLRKTVVAKSSSIFAIAQTVGAFTPTAQSVKTWELRSVEA